MTTILARRSSGGFRCAIRASGHATGSEKACAAVSAILYALAGYLKNAEADRRLPVVEIRLESGDAVLDFWADEEAKGAFEMAVIGLAQVAKAEPERVSVRICED